MAPKRLQSEHRIQHGSKTAPKWYPKTKKRTKKQDEKRTNKRSDKKSQHGRSHLGAPPAPEESLPLPPDPPSQSHRRQWNATPSALRKLRATFRHPGMPRTVPALLLPVSPAATSGVRFAELNATLSRFSHAQSRFLSSGHADHVLKNPPVHQPHLNATVKPIGKSFRISSK